MTPVKQTPPKRCELCGKTFERSRYNGRMEDAGRFARRRFCTRLCANNSLRKESPTLSALYKRVAALPVRENRCETCGAVKMLGIHHVDGDQSNNEKSNLMTLCPSCHTRWHWQHGKQIQRKHECCAICQKSPRSWEHMKRGMCSLHYYRWRAEQLKTGPGRQLL